jgi:SAM-dependent methyltransferase
MPPPHLVYLVTGQFDCEAFYKNGVVGAKSIQDILRRNGLDFDTFRKVLDFGCGCGRVMRQRRDVGGPKLYGVDYNPRLVDWCRANLPFAEFAVNTSASPLQFAEGSFDFIYSISVFTHLTEECQQFWMGELTRVLKPGGYLLITVHGMTRLHQLTPEQREQFEAGRVVVTHSRYSGRNMCATYHPDSYVRGVLCRNLNAVAFEPGAARDANQDVFLLQKPN